MGRATVRDGSSQRTGRGDSAGHASVNVSPSLCLGLPFIRSTRGSSDGDGRLDESNLTRREQERVSETRLEHRSCSSSRTAQGAACNSVVIHIYRSDRQE